MADVDTTLSGANVVEGTSEPLENESHMDESETPMLKTTSPESNPSQPQRDDGIKSSPLESKILRFRAQWILALTAVAVSIFSTYYSYRVMISQDAVPIAFAITPGQTVLVVNILSHLVAYMCWTLFSNVTEALRWALACGLEGVDLTTFLALSRATPLTGVAYLCIEKGYHQVWSIQRFMAILIVTLLGLVLITDVTFKDVYNSSSVTQPLNVVAGLAPLNASLLLGADQGGLVSLYITAYSMGFVTDPKYVTAVSPISCTSGPRCKSLFLPGSLELARMQGNNENATLFSSTLPGDYTTIVIENAPGFHLEFNDLGAGFVFNQSVCTRYGQSIHDGLYICLAQDGPTMVAGWSVCPQEVAVNHACSTNMTWTESADWSMQVSLWQRFATVAYDGTNNSILSIESIGKPTTVPLNPLDFKILHDIAFSDVPQVMDTSNSTIGIAANSYTAQAGLMWLLRLYLNEFSTYENGGLDLLKGLLAVSVQFNTQMWASIDFEGLPDNMKTTATLQKASYRALIRPWTVWVFGVLAFVILFWSIGCLTWVCLRGPYSPNASMFPEIDIISKSSCHNLPRSLFQDQRVELSEDTLEDLGKLTRMKGLGNGMSRAVVDAIKDKRIRCGSYITPDHYQQMIIIVTKNDPKSIQPLEPTKGYI